MTISCRPEMAPRVKANVPWFPSTLRATNKTSVSPGITSSLQFSIKFYRVSSKEVVKEWFQKPKSQNLPIKGGGPLFPIGNCRQLRGQKVSLEANNAKICFLQEIHQYMAFIANYTKWELKKVFLGKNFQKNVSGSRVAGSIGSCP